jgi:hypothetical protein
VRTVAGRPQARADQQPERESHQLFEIHAHPLKIHQAAPRNATSTHKPM